MGVAQARGLGALQFVGWEMKGTRECPRGTNTSKGRDSVLLVDLSTITFCKTQLKGRDSDIHGRVWAAALQ